METEMTTASDTRSGESGFTLIEVLVSIVVLLLVSATALDGIRNLSKNTRTVTNRTEMHAGVRNATELLQQEVGQAGRISLPAGITLAAPISSTDTQFTASSVTGMWAGQYLDVDTGGSIDCTDPGLVGTLGKCTETVQVKQINGNVVTIETDDSISKGHTSFWWSHDNGAPITIGGAFAWGVVPKGVPNGSDDFLLKMFGDINGNGNMTYVEYWCDVAGGNLYRRETPYTSANKPGPSPNQVLLNNITQNPNNAPCFVYQQPPAIFGQTFVTDVAITLTVQTAVVDATTGLFQKETKALLNVSPRNVFNVWLLANQDILYRVQPMPPTVGALLQVP
jgi:prepilin-type N-terminal cleavage/methylation domain-containing protein